MTKYSISDTAFFVKIEERIVILNLSDLKVTKLDDVATVAWDYLIENPCSNLNAISEDLCKFYTVDQREIKQDLQVLFKSLAQKGLLLKNKASSPNNFGISRKLDDLEKIKSSLQEELKNKSYLRMSNFLNDELSTWVQDELKKAQFKVFYSFSLVGWRR